MENCDECESMNTDDSEIKATYDFGCVTADKLTVSEMERDFFSCLRRGLGLYSSCKRHANRPDLLSEG